MALFFPVCLTSPTKINTAANNTRPKIRKPTYHVQTPLLLDRP
ncbi:hypothetical protein VDG1235_507 [Verrucomicrobiia bacterium DG1235]|nr:hypothetical protein VDG1235_507 [Verrucomicrobiae bacterium DG1235]